MAQIPNLHQHKQHLLRFHTAVHCTYWCYVSWETYFSLIMTPTTIIMLILTVLFHLAYEECII